MGADAGRCVLTGHVDGLALLEHLPEPFREVLGRFPQHLPGKDIADGILDDARLLFTVVTYQLTEILRAQTDGHLVAAGRGYQGVEPFEIYRRNLVHQDGALKLSLTVHHLDDTGVVQPQGRRIDVLPVRVVAYAQYLWLIRVIDIQREVVPAHDPVERGADHARERDLGTCDLALELLHRPAFPGVHERREVVLQLPVRGQDGEYVRVGLVQQLDGVGEGTVLPVLVDFEIPYDGGKRAMLAWGVTLDLPMTQEEVDGCTIYTVNDGDLVACFTERITDNVVAAMADKTPLRVLFRDSCFAQDDQKINIYEQFKQLMDWTDDEAFKNIKVI